MPRKMVYRREIKQLKGGFNEAEAVMPRKIFESDIKSGSKLSFNEAEAVMPRKIVSRLIQQ